MQKSNIKWLGISNILVGLLSILYLLIQNGTIVLNMFVEDHRYNQGFDTFINVFMVILSLLSIILIFFNIKKGHNKIKSYCSLASVLLFINVAGMALDRMVTIFSFLIPILGIAILFIKEDK